MSNPLPDKNCVVDAWRKHEAEIRGYLARHVPDARTAEDILQDTFVKAIKEGAGFCQLENPRAWLFKVARNNLTDFYRRNKPSTELDEEFTEDTVEIPAVETLSACLPRALRELSENDREALTRCDLQGVHQADYAEATGLSLAAAKSRIRRARERLKQKLKENCQVRFADSGHVCCYVPPTKSSK